MSSDYSPEFLFKCKSDFAFFCENVLKLEMEPYHKEICKYPLMYKQLCIIIPRGHSKTTLFSIAYPLWRLFKHRDIEICITSSSLDQSKKILSKVQYELESKPFFQDLLPKNRMDAWNKQEISTSNHNSYYIKPFNSSARGMYPHYKIYDDVLRDDDVTPEAIKEIFWSVFFPAGKTVGCQDIIVGTPLSPDDLYAEIERKSAGSVWNVIKRQAVIEDAKGKWLRPLWEKRFSLQDLREIRDSMSPFRFEREYMCRPRSTGDTLYPMEMLLNCVDYNLEFSYKIEGMIYVGCDFAMSTKMTGDYNVFTVVEDASGHPYTKHTDKGDIEIKNHVFVRKMIRFRGNMRHVDKIKGLNDDYGGTRIIGDNSGVGAKFVRELRDESLTVDAQEFQPARRNLILMNLRTLIEKNRIVIPGGPESNPLTNILLNELSGFRSVKSSRTGYESWQSNLQHDDTVMSLAMAVKNISNPRKIMKDFIFGV